VDILPRMTDNDVLDQLADALGGKGKRGRKAKLAEALGITPTRLSNWLERGIPWPKRPVVLKLAERAGKRLPAKFLSEQKRAA
jgi:transcriptional regulator with XRE-family HTH domain